MRAAAEIGAKAFTFVVIATRGKRLALSRIRASGWDQGPEDFHTDALGVVEINADKRITARVAFDLDDIDAAFAELDARYLAGEAAPYARAWSANARAFAAVNSGELPDLTPDWVNIDHRRTISFAPGEMSAYIHATWELESDFDVYIEAVHRLSNLGAVVTQVASGTSQQGFEAEYRAINLSTVDGDLINRAEIFDEADLDAALARFDELHHTAPRLENAASRQNERYRTYFASRDWKAMAAILADGVVTDDRRRVVNAGVRQGRDAELANLQTLADVVIDSDRITSTTVATRGQRLALSRVRVPAIQTEALNLTEIDAEERIVARIGFDIDDIDAAFAELDARYLAGEAAAHAHTWSVIAESYASIKAAQATAVHAELREHRSPPWDGFRAR